MHRRTFLTSTAAGSLLSLSSLNAIAKETLPIKAGQIGTKHAHASGQMETMRRLPDYEVVGVVEPDDGQWARVSQTKDYKDVPRLTEEQLLGTAGLKVVAVESEIRDLLATAKRCIEAGMHVHIDKPAGESLDELRDVQAAANKRSLTIQMGYMYRYNAGFQFLYKAVADGWLGEVFEVHAVMSKISDEAARREMAEYPGGAMFELGCHLIDPLLHVMGPPTNVTPFNRSTRTDEKLLDNTLAVFEYPKATATIRSALVEVDGFRRRQFVVCGTEGTIAIRRLDQPELELTLAKPRGGFKKGTHLVDLPASKGRYDGAWDAVARSIRGEQPFSYSSEHDFNVQKAILAASGVQAWSDA